MKKIIAWIILIPMLFIPAVIISVITLFVWAVKVLRNEPEKYFDLYKDFLFIGLLDKTDV